MDRSILVAVVSSGAFTALLNFIFNIINEKRKQGSDISKALMCLLGYEIKAECHRLLKENEITLNDLEQLQELNNVYHEMGGNGYVKTLMDKTEELPIKKE